MSIKSTDNVDLAMFNESGIVSALGSDRAKVIPIVAADDAIVVQGTPNSDWLIGNVLDNVFNGGEGADTMGGGAGDDTYRVDEEHDVIIEKAGGGVDTVMSSTGYSLPNNVENLRLVGTVGTFGEGNQLNNTLYGNEGDNWLDGGEGLDTVSYHFAKAPVTVSLATQEPQGTGGAGIDTLLNIERLMGSRYADHLIGDQNDNTLRGGGGEDTLEGDAGSDLLFGGEGSDTFVLSSLDGTDRLSDFTHWIDHLSIDQTHLPVGNGDGLIEHAAVVSGLDSFSPKAEFVRFANQINGKLTVQAAAAMIRGPSQAYDKGDQAIFLVDNGKNTGVFYFTSRDADNRVATPELTLLGVVSGTKLGLDDVTFDT